MRLGRSFIPFWFMALILTMLTGVSAMAGKNADTGPGEKNVPYKQISVGEYQNFLKNWDETKHPVLYALIRTPAQYDALFSPAATLWNKRAFAPAAEFYKTGQILLVGRVMMAPRDMDKVFEVERLTERDQELELHYRFIEPVANTWTTKIFLPLQIPRHLYRKVVFVENGKPVGELNMAKGQWSVPKMEKQQ